MVRLCVVAIVVSSLACESERKPRDRSAELERSPKPERVAEKPDAEQKPPSPPKREPRPTGSEIFDHLLGDRDQIMSASQLVAASTGELVALGTSTRTPGTNSEVFMVGFDGLGVVDWQRGYAKLGSQLPAAAIATDAGVVFAANGFSDRSPWLGRVDAKTGELAWTKSIHDKHCEVAGLAAFAGDLVVAGHCRGPSERRFHPWIGRFDGEGERVWLSDLGDPDVWVQGLIVAGDQVIALGSDGSSDELNFEAWIGWVDGEGQLQRSKTYGGPGPQHFKQAAVTPEGLVVGGSSGESVGEEHRRWPWVLGLTLDGKRRWTHETKDQVGMLNAIVSIDDDLLLLGHSGDWIYGQAWMTRLDGKGKPVWSRTYGKATSGTLRDAVVLADGRIVTVGIQPISGSANTGFWLMGVDSQGEPEGPRSARARD